MSPALIIIMSGHTISLHGPNIGHAKNIGNVPDQQTNFISTQGQKDHSGLPNKTFKHHLNQSQPLTAANMPPTSSQVLLAGLI
ncbi:MAG: hypothetical protein JWR07_3678 [Nevskia sp.]|nr:hypothetical protein [Nevskia sp.]